MYNPAVREVYVHVPVEHIFDILFVVYPACLCSALRKGDYLLVKLTIFSGIKIRVRTVESVFKCIISLVSFI